MRHHSTLDVSRLWIASLLICLVFSVGCKSEQESLSADDPTDTESPPDPDPSTAESDAVSGEVARADAPASSANAPDASTLDTRAAGVPSRDAVDTSTTPESTGDLVIASTDPVAVPGDLDAARKALPGAAVVVSGGVATTDTGDLWLTVNGIPLMLGPDAARSGAMSASACETVAEGEYQWFWVMPSAPVTVLALGERALVYAWDPARTCFVTEPLLIEPELPQLKVLNAGVQEIGGLSVIEVDLFPDSPGNEILSVGAEGFRVDRGSGPGAIRTGRFGLPITRTETRPTPTPAVAAWEARLAPLPAGAKWAATPPTRGPADLKGMDAREILEAAWDDSIPLLASAPYPSSDAVHPDWVEDDDSIADDDEDEETEDGDCYEEDEDQGYDLTVASVTGGWLFMGSMYSNQSADYCGESTTATEVSEETHLFRLRDGRVLAVLEGSESLESADTSGYEEDGSNLTLEQTNTASFYVASELGLGLEDRELPGARSVDDAHRLVRDVSAAESSSSGTSPESWVDVEFEGAACGVAIGFSSDSATAERAVVDWSTDGGISGLVAFDMEQPGTALELSIEGVTHKPVAPYDKPRKVVKGRLFGTKRQRLVANPSGIEVLDSDGSTLVSFPLECTAKTWDAAKSSLTVNANVTATPLGHDLVHIEGSQTVMFEAASESIECDQTLDLTIHGPSGTVIRTESLDLTSTVAEAESCEEEEEED